MSKYSKSELNEMLAQDKVYCFAYDLEDDKVYGEGYNSYKYREDAPYLYLISDDELDAEDSFEDISVSVEDVVNEALQVTKTDEGTTIYLYTFNNDVNRFLEIVNKEYTELLAKYRKAVEFYENMLNKLNATQKRIKEQYPNGVKERKGAEKG